MATYSPTNAAGIITAINTSAGSGDTVSLPSGTFDCTASTLTPAAGVTITGPGIRQCVISAKWDVDGGGGAAITMSDFSMDITGLTDITTFGPVECSDGTFYLDRIEIVGAGSGTGNGLTFYRATSATIGVCRNVIVRDVGADGISTKAASAAAAGDSLLTLYDCQVYRPGTGAGDQALTAHDDFVISAHGGVFSNIETSTSPCLGPGLGAGADVTPMYLSGCEIVGYAIDVVRLERCTIHRALTAYAVRWNTNLPETPRMVGCYLPNCGGGVYLNTDSAAVVEGCLFTNANSTGTLTIPSTASGTFSFNNNTFVTCARPIQVYDDNSPTINLYNNVIDSPVNNATYVRDGGGTVTWNSGGNVFYGASASHGTTGAATAYSPVASDITTQPEYDSDYVPTAAGNLDGSGSTSVSLTAAVDVYGRQLQLSPLVISRGAVARDYSSGGQTAATTTTLTTAQLRAALLNGALTDYETEGTVGGELRSIGTDAAAAKTRVELALPNAAADAAGGLAISDAGGLDLDALLADTAELQGLFTTGGTLRLLFPGSTIAAASDVTAIGTASDRSLRRPADAFIFRVARRSDGTYTTDRTLRLRPGTTESIRIGLDMSRLTPRQFVYSVGTPSVSGGSLTATSPERYDELATYVVGGTATASESRTIDVTVTMEQGDVFVVTLPVEVFAD